LSLFLVQTYTITDTDVTKVIVFLSLYVTRCSKVDILHDQSYPNKATLTNSISISQTFRVTAVSITRRYPSLSRLLTDVIECNSYFYREISSNFHEEIKECVNAGDCFLPFADRIFEHHVSRVVFKIINVITMHNTIIPPVVFGVWVQKRG